MNEKPWTDNRIRWKEDDVSAASSDGDENSAAPDPFQEDPHEQFSFHFPSPSQRGTDGEDDEDEKLSPSMIHIKLQGYKYESDPIWKSTGLTLWKAAQYLGEYLATQASISNWAKEKRILELGAGLGLCGILSHRIGDSSTAVVLTDGDTDALAQLRENVALNKRDNGTIACQQLLWGKENAETFLEYHHGGTFFDIILASDVIYVPDVVEPLFATVQTLLCPTSGKFILAYKKRDVPVTNEMVLAAAKAAGFFHTCPVRDTPEGIFLYEFRRPSSLEKLT